MSDKLDGVKSALKFIDGLALPLKPPPGCTAELLDENDEQGIVVIREPCGSIRMMMPRDVYDAVMEWQRANPESDTQS
jgi:hypothetical protein